MELTFMDAFSWPSIVSNGKPRRTKAAGLKKPSDLQLTEWIKLVKSEHPEFGWKRVLRELKSRHGNVFDVSEWRVKRLMRQCDLMVRGEHSMSPKLSSASTSSSEFVDSPSSQCTLPFEEASEHGHLATDDVSQMSGGDVFLRASGALTGGPKMGQQFIDFVFRSTQHGHSLLFDELVRLVTFVNRLDDLEWFLHRTFQDQMRFVNTLAAAADACRMFPSDDRDALGEYVSRITEAFMTLTGCMNLTHAECDSICTLFDVNSLGITSSGECPY